MKKSQVNITIFNTIQNIIGKSFAKKLLFHLHKKRLSRHKVIFIHIPKSAGTSITNEIYGGRIGHFTASECKKYLGTYRFNSFFKFSVTRNPYDRLVSSYFYATQGGTSEGGINNPSLYQSYPFRTFKSFVKEWLVYQKMDKVEMIFRPQYLFLYENDKLLVDYIGKVEALKEVEEELFIKLNISYNFNHLNRSVRNKSYHQYYDEETKRIVKTIYKKDFDYLGYEVE